MTEILSKPKKKIEIPLDTKENYLNDYEIYKMIEMTL